MNYYVTVYLEDIYINYQSELSFILRIINENQGF